jgi:hypothetical protein
VAFLLLGHRVWPAILLGAFVVNITTAGSVATLDRDRDGQQSGKGVVEDGELLSCVCRTAFA